MGGIEYECHGREKVGVMMLVDVDAKVVVNVNVVIAMPRWWRLPSGDYAIRSAEEIVER